MFETRHSVVYNIAIKAVTMQAASPMSYFTVNIVLAQATTTVKNTTRGADL